MQALRVHYLSTGDIADWGLHVWLDVATPTSWEEPLPIQVDRDGGSWLVPLADHAQRVGLVVHRGEDKDGSGELFVDLETLCSQERPEIWIVGGRQTFYLVPPTHATQAGDLLRQRGHWLSTQWLTWNTPAEPDDRFFLHASDAANLRPTKNGISHGRSWPLEPAEIPADILMHRPHLGSQTSLRLDARVDVATLIRGQLALSRVNSDGELLDCTALQIAGLLDEICAHDEPLGIEWRNGVPSLHLWAPTARSVNLLRFESSADRAAHRTVSQVVAGARNEHGTWTFSGQRTWDRSWYEFEIDVFAPTRGRFETVRVTDPYSRSLAANGTRSQIVNLDDGDLGPDDWKTFSKPQPIPPAEIVLYELHVRDFSAMESSLTPELQGTYLAFAKDTPGIRHLETMAQAGLSHIHLLPCADFATVEERRELWSPWPSRAIDRPDSDWPQKILDDRTRANSYNWGYDPQHFGVPEGSYATDPDGPARIVEFRTMVRALAARGLRVIMDVVYNHTYAASPSHFAVLDSIVPGYYHRLDEQGELETSTCCANTASEHAMMQRLMVDDVVHWAIHYRIDGFRFDLMGHHMKRNMQAIRRALDALTMQEHGVDGRDVYVYGEGWDFGEVQGGRRGVNATKHNMAGTGIGAFNDRLRDAVRGGGSSQDPGLQGFVTGRFDSIDDAPGQNLEIVDDIRAGLAGNLARFTFEHADGESRAASERCGGVATQPTECINFVSVHDDYTLYDKIAMAAPAHWSAAERSRAQSLALAIVLLGQGVPFLHAGSELLRSKSLDRNSYRSGDWFNRLDFSRTTHNFGVGMPPERELGPHATLVRQTLQRAELKAKPHEIESCANAVLDLLRVRHASPLLRLAQADLIRDGVRFLNTGPEQIPGLIVMSIEASADIDPGVSQLVVALNARRDPAVKAFDALRGKDLTLHPMLAGGHDPIARQSGFDPQSGQLDIPGQTSVVFEARR